MAATLRWATAGRGGCERRCGCRYSLKLISQRFEQDELEVSSEIKAEFSKAVEALKLNKRRTKKEPS